MEVQYNSDKRQTLGTRRVAKRELTTCAIGMGGAHVIARAGCFFEVSVFILKSMFWRAAQNSAKMRVGARASRARQRGFFRVFVQPSRTSTSE